ncbi:hypothetical protein MVEN_01299300 [Mycena venus]|uniref:Uncharacterized protein n=1 Tax=Mycena venus TaxID=2733690 RepID=A0A8H6Y0K3_9AGAR|nr:hypothetical protein MVEN_01299300 [Mycena venus]
MNENGGWSGAVLDHPELLDASCGFSGCGGGIQTGHGYAGVEARHGCVYKQEQSMGVDAYGATASSSACTSQAHAVVERLSQQDIMLEGSGNGARGWETEDGDVDVVDNVDAGTTSRKDRKEPTRGTAQVMQGQRWSASAQTQAPHCTKYILILHLSHAFPQLHRRLLSTPIPAGLNARPITDGIDLKQTLALAASGHVGAPAGARCAMHSAARCDPEKPFRWTVQALASYPSFLSAVTIVKVVRSTHC